MRIPVLLSAGCTCGQVADQGHSFPATILGAEWPESVYWEKLQLDGFYILKPKKMVELQGDAIIARYGQGYLKLAHALLFSLENFHRLVALAAGNVV